MAELLPTDDRLHAICKTIRESTWAGIDESRAVCHGCPAAVESPYGPGTQGCYLLALEVFNLAVQGNAPQIRHDVLALRASYLRNRAVLLRALDAQGLPSSWLSGWDEKFERLGKALHDDVGASKDG